jgi:uncharacterized protein YfbU (UPF0304 family)
MQALTERFEMRLDQETLHSVDSWRAKQPDVPSRGEAVRRLVERGLMQEQALQLGYGERLILAMLCDLVKGLKVKTELDTDLIMQALLGGHYWGFQMAMGGLLHSHVDSPDVVKEVINILDMFSFIESAYAKLSTKDKERVKKEAQPFGDNPRFQGFDGNNESEHLSVAGFLVEDLKRFPQFAGRGHLNSHGHKLDTYRRMLAKFEPLREKLAYGPMSADQIIDVLNAKLHPSRRKR